MALPEVISLRSAGEDETTLMAKRLASLLEPGDLLTFDGNLGAGKTFFIRALCEALEVPREAGVSSPSYSLVNLYEGGRIPIAHLDLYRLGHEEELEALGFRDLLDDDRLVLIEWPGQAGGLEDLATIQLQIEDLGPSRRQFTFRCQDPELRASLQETLGV
jgi:tRNA threonylcarbamoyl adenosine modification protein YjeE